MTNIEAFEIISKARKEGKRPNLSGADLSYADLRYANLKGAYLSCANLINVDLYGANLKDANLSCANLKDADLRDADLSCANLYGADLYGADLRGANLSNANLSNADLRGADLSCANLYGADLRDANLSGSKGLLDPTDWMQRNFKRSKNCGFLVYKAFGSTYRKQPENWALRQRRVISEEVNPNRTNVCGCGVNFATLEWIMNDRVCSKADEIWLCRIEPIDFLGVVVPYNTDGKARCQKLTLVRRLRRSEIERSRNK